VAEAFVAFVIDKEAQRAYSKFGLRPVDPDVAAEVKAEYPPVEDLWKIDFLGGWPKVSKDIFGQDGVFTKTIASIHATRK
jgi:sulfate transport system substrate-binding protein